MKKNKVTITYKKAKSASGYAVYHATKKNGKYKKVATLKSLKKTFKVKKGSHYYKLRAYKKVGKKTIYTGYSSIVKAKVK